MANQPVTLTGTFTLSQQGGVMEEAPVAATLREALEAKGVDLSSPVMHNGKPAILGDAVADGDIVTVAKPGEGA